MDKSCNYSNDSSTVSASSTGNNTGNNRDHHYLRQLNKLSHKISKPTPTSSSAVNQETSQQPLPPINNGNLHQHQPPVYNINKNDFRNVVQRLTGSPSHERISSAPPPPPPQQQSSRLHRIRPPPLAHVTNRPPCLLNDAHRNNWSGGFVPRPLSPLPPLPPVHAAAESPVSSYMRYLQSSMFSGLSPLAPPPQHNTRPPHPPPSAQSFGCLGSPESPYGLLSPSLLLSPTSGQVGFQVSPTTLPLHSPKFKGH